MNGPSYNICSNYYKSINSLIYIQELLNDIPEQQGFYGGQGFKFPRTGFYNVTIAGAAGGRGLCSIRGGYGAILTNQLYIQKDINDSVLILVGQKGTSPCETNRSHSLCQTPPVNITEAEQCNSTWSNIAYVGGGGGGGGSMIWGPNSTGQYTKTTLPVIAAAGGGGTGTQLVYSAVIGEKPELIVGTSTFVQDNETHEEFYIRWINGQPTDVDDLNPNNSGNVGNRPGSVTAGYGSGWVNAFGELMEIDGKLINTNIDFAEGGYDCVLGFDKSQVGVPFLGVNGGFGGGGGACSEGGGGGGYGGGWVVGETPSIPGRGGYSFVSSELNGEFVNFNDGAGYVKIIPVDCGCSHSCTVDGESFQCECPQLARLASDGYNCVRGKVLTCLYLCVNV